VLLGTKSRVVSSRQVATCKLRYTLPEPVLAIYGMRDPNESMSAMAMLRQMALGPLVLSSFSWNCRASF